MTQPFDYRGKVALITGASSGIGRAFAFALAQRGASLVLVARSGDVLQQLADTLQRDYGCRADVLPADLAAIDAASIIDRQLAAADIRVDVLVNCAGFATYGRFETIPLARQRDELMVNCLAPMALTHALLPGMLARGSGAIVNVASTAAFQPDPYMAIYGATKSFLLSFSEALWAESRARGVRVLALCPGATQTAFFDVVDAEEAAVGARMPVERVVDDALWALDRHRSHRVVGTRNRWLANLQRVLSRQTSLALVEKILRPRRP